MSFWWFFPSTLITNSQMVIVALELYAACLMYVSPEVNIVWKFLYVSLEVNIVWGIIALTQKGNINSIII